MIFFYFISNTYLKPIFIFLLDGKSFEQVYSQKDGSVEEEKSKSIHEMDEDDLLEVEASQRERQREHEKERIEEYRRKKIEEENEHQNVYLENIHNSDNKFSFINANRAEQEKTEFYNRERQRSFGNGNYEFSVREHHQQPIIVECEKKEGMIRTSATDILGSEVKFKPECNSQKIK